MPTRTPGAIAWKALAVNVSDLVAKGAAPLAYLMTLALPDAPERTWLAAFADGLGARKPRSAASWPAATRTARRARSSVSITAFGTVPIGPHGAPRDARVAGDARLRVGHHRRCGARGWLCGAIRRSAERWRLDAGARASTRSGYLPAAAAGGLAPVVRECASAAMDISDGLVKDFERMCRAAGVGGRLEAARVPLSAPARAVARARGRNAGDLLTGGEDYEVLAAVAPERAGEFERAGSRCGNVA